jgi:hypothetical protein
VCFHSTSETHQPYHVAYRVIEIPPDGTPSAMDLKFTDAASVTQLTNHTNLAIFPSDLVHWIRSEEVLAFITNSNMQS